MMFREVLSATVDELRRLAVFKPDHELTIVRDVEGRIRLIVGTRNPALAPFPDLQVQQGIAAALGARLGGWLASPPVWLDDEPPRTKGRPEKRAAHLALDLARQYRVLAPWSSKSGDPVWFLLERHSAKRAWVGEVQPQPPWAIDEVDAGRKPPVVTFFSHKGGVGRSTALVATALHLARAHQRVAVVDLDIEAPGLSSLLLPNEPVAGTLDYLVEASVGSGTIARDVTAFVSDTAFVESGPGLQVVPAGPVNDAFLEMLARVDLQDPAATSTLAERIRRLFMELHALLGPLDFILVDARAGLHEVAGLMLAGLSHGAVVIGTDSPQSWMGVTQVARLLSAPYVRDGKEPRPLILVHGMAPPATDPRYEFETKSFRTRAYDGLSANYYPQGQVPGEQEKEKPHWPVVVPWTSELRGGGGLLTPAVVSVLMGAPYRELTERLGKLFGRTLKWGANT
jgi:MinD-like ATPase involved in chromosome partitioning or flagellar assembly